MADRTGLFGLSCPHPAGHPLKTRMLKIVPDDFVEPFEPRLCLSSRVIHAARSGDQMDLNMADRTGFEPATSGVTGRHSNQLNYRSIE